MKVNIIYETERNREGYSHNYQILDEDKRDVKSEPLMQSLIAVQLEDLRRDNESFLEHLRKGNESFLGQNRKLSKIKREVEVEF